MAVTRINRVPGLKDKVRLLLLPEPIDERTKRSRFPLDQLKMYGGGASGAPNAAEKMKKAEEERRMMVRDVRMSDLSWMYII